MLVLNISESLIVKININSINSRTVIYVDRLVIRDSSAGKQNLDLNTYPPDSLHTDLPEKQKTSISYVSCKHISCRHDSEGTNFQYTL